TYPAFFLTEWMRDEGFDPNWQGGLSEEELESIFADNEDRFASAIAAIQAGDFQHVRLPREAVDLRADWNARMDEIDALERAIDAGVDADGDEVDRAALEAELAELRADI